MTQTTFELLPVDDLLEKIKRYHPATDEALIRKAYDFGREAHEGQFRKSGEPYFTHPIEVATLLTEIRIDDSSIVTALLHDTIEDTKVSFEDVEREFSTEIAELVNGVTKLTNLELSSKQSAEAENLRKLLLAMSKDVRVLLVKLADRLHNMRTIKSMAPDRQRVKARETMEIYAPLAGRMGMQYLREELEDLAFQVLNPKARESILRKFITLRGEKGGAQSELLQTILADIRKLLELNGIHAYVTGREKRPHSVWRKIHGKGEGFERLSDIYGFRILTSSVEDCYRTLGAVHSRWAAIPGRFKDYISQPKQNGYRSIHTTVSGRDGKRVEFQIRSREMHIVAESGVAAHWAYKDGKRGNIQYEVDPSGWLSALNAGLDDHDDHEEFIEIFKMEVYSDQVFVFSPKGKVVNLPRGATAIDFAYAIHSKVGDHAVGAIIDGIRKPLSTVVRNGQTVNIIQAEAARPQSQWAEVAKTGRAKSAIKRAFKMEKREHDAALGKDIFRAALSLVNKSPNDKTLAAAARANNFDSVDDMLAALGAAEIRGHEIIEGLYPELTQNFTNDIDPVALPPMIGSQPAFSSRPAMCCMPVPGDRIVGLARRGAGVEYHAIDCDCLADNEPDDETHWMDLSWPKDLTGAIYPTKVKVTMAHDAGILGRVCNILGENHANIEQVDFVQKRADFYTVLFEIQVRNDVHVYNIITALNAEEFVSDATRYREILEPILP